MVGVLTGDVIRSRGMDVQLWMPVLVEVLQKLTAQDKQWDIYRGDSFQLEVPVEQALKAAFTIKAALKSKCDLDVRIAIGVGSKSFESTVVSQSNGSAFVNSGESFEKLKNKSLNFQSDNDEVNLSLNLVFNLISRLIDQWTAVSSSLILILLEQPQLSQTELANQTGRSQSNVSTALKRGGYEELTQVLQYYAYSLSKL